MKVFIEYKTYAAGVVEIPDDINDEEVYNYLQDEIDRHNLYCDIDPNTGGYNETIIENWRKIDC